jgi:uroporphyrinogen decarboxylase
MKSREIVIRAIEHTGPERVPGSMPKPYWNDFFGGHVDYPRGPENRWHRVDDTRWEHIDEWGNTWARIEDFSKGEVSQGALTSMDDVETVPLPDLGNPAYYASVKKAYEERAGDHFRLGSVPGFAFNIARKMRRLDQYLMDLVLDTERVMILHDRINDVLEAMIRQYARAGADGIMTGEDWGTQLAMMISPDMWREIFKPGFVRLCNAAHEEGLKVLFHSCGKITAIVPDMIDAGIDVLQFDQPRVHGIDTLNQWADKVTYWCPVDIQTTLQTGDADLIDADAKEMIEKLGGHNGGFIAGYYGGNEAIGVDPDIQEIACQAFVRYGWYNGKK